MSIAVSAAVFGHEYTGTGAGGRVTAVAARGRVIGSVEPPCRSCATCRAGHPDHCGTAFAEAKVISPHAPAHSALVQHVTFQTCRIRRALDGLTGEQLRFLDRGRRSLTGAPASLRCFSPTQGPSLSAANARVSATR